MKKGASIFLGAIFIIGFIAPYSHIFFNNSDTKGLFGFPTMSSFLFSIGFPIFSIVLAVLLNHAIYYLPISLKKLFRIFTFLTAFTGFYFLIWSINPYVKKDFHPTVYYGTMIMISIILSYSIRLYNWNTVSLLKGKIRYIMSLMVDRALENNHIKDKNRYEEEIIYPALDKLDER